jgi:hypothetical protein
MILIGDWPLGIPGGVRILYVSSFIVGSPAGLPELGRSE